MIALFSKIKLHNKYYYSVDQASRITSKRNNFESRKVKTNKFLKKNTLKPKFFRHNSRRLSFKQLAKKFTRKKKKRRSLWNKNKKPFWRQKSFLRRRRYSNFVLSLASHIRGVNLKELNVEDINERHSWTYNVKYRRARFNFRNKICIRKAILYRYGFKTQKQLKKYHLKVYKASRPFASGFSVLEGRISHVAVRLGWLRSIRVAIKAIRLGILSINGGIFKNPNTRLKKGDVFLIRKKFFAKAVATAKKFYVFRRRARKPIILKKSKNQLLSLPYSLMYKRRFQDIKRLRLLQFKSTQKKRKRCFKRKRPYWLLKKRLKFYRLFLYKIFSYATYISTTTVAVFKPVLQFTTIFKLFWFCCLFFNFFFNCFFNFFILFNLQQSYSAVLFVFFLLIWVRVTFNLVSIFCADHLFTLEEAYNLLFSNALATIFLLVCDLCCLSDILNKNFFFIVFGVYFTLKLIDSVTFLNLLFSVLFLYSYLANKYCYSIYSGHFCILNITCYGCFAVKKSKRVILRCRNKKRRAVMKKKRYIKTNFRRFRFSKRKRSKYFYRRIPWKPINSALKYLGLHDRLTHPLPISVLFKNILVIYNEIHLKKRFFKKKLLLKRISSLIRSRFFNLRKYRARNKALFTYSLRLLMKQRKLIFLKQKAIRPSNRQFELSRRKAGFILISGFKFSTFAWLKSANVLQINRKVFDVFSNQKLY